MNDHPELETKNFLDTNGIQQHQSLIVLIQWEASLGRIDITSTAMIMLSFTVEPRIGCMGRIKKTHDCL